MLLLIGALAWGQDAPPPAPLAAPASRLPELAWSPRPRWTQESLARGAPGEALLRLQIDDQGRVIGFELLSASSPDFEAMARALAPELRFQPALDPSGRPTAAVIEYRHRFLLERAPTVSIAGRVQLAGQDRPLEGVRVLAIPAQGGPEASVERQTGPDGRFELLDLPPGSYLLRAIAPGLRSDELEIEVRAGEVVEVRLYPQPAPPLREEGPGEELIVTGERLQPELTERRLDAREIRRIPGTGGDIVRAIQTLPGVARTPFNSGTLLVRGTPTDSTALLMGGTRLPLVYHFGGLATAINGDMLEELRFLPGAWGVPYGRRMGGLIDLVPRAEPSDEARGYAAVDLLQSTLFQDLPTGPRSSISLSLRRSYFDALLSPVVNLDPDARLRLPGFTDGQLHYRRRGDRGGRLGLMLLGSEDHLSYRSLTAEGEEGDSRLYIRFLRLWARSSTPLGMGWHLESGGTVGPESTRAVLEGKTIGRDRGLRGHARVEINRPLLPGAAFGWRFGADLELSVDDRFRYAVNDLAGFYAFAEDERGRDDLFMPGLWFEQAQRAGALTFIPGLRWDAMLTRRGYQARALDPRARLRWDIDPRLVLSVGGGRYSQFPQHREFSDQGIGNPKLGPEHADQLAVGLEARPREGLSFESTAWLSMIAELVVGHEDRFVFELSPPPMAPFDLGNYANAGVGRAYGLELLGRFEQAPWSASASLSLSRSARRERPDGDWTLFEYDQPYAVHLLGSRALPKGWTVGTRARLIAGNPYTPVGNRIYDQGEQAWLPVFDMDERARLPPWMSLDARVDKQWTFRRWALTGYLDVQNLTNRRNVELLAWSFDFREELHIVGLPILPTFGLRGDW